MSLALRSNRLNTSSASLHVRRELVADAQVGERRRLRALRVVFDQRPRPEVAQLELAEPRAEVRRPSRRARPPCRPIRGCGRRAAIVVGVKRARETREVGVEQQPGRRRVVVVPLDAAAPARAARLGVAGVADEDQLGAELQVPERERALQAGHDLGAHAELAALRAHERRRPDRAGSPLLGVDRGGRRRARRCCGSRGRS